MTTSRSPLLLPLLTAWIWACAGLFGMASAEPLELKLPEPLGEKCVEPTEIMRRQHSQFLGHQQDEVVLDGVRAKKHSLRECLNCHVRPNAAGAFPRHTDDGHFCAVCHEFTSVSIDCFSCHADRPDSFYEKNAAPPHAQTHDRAYTLSVDGFVAAQARHRANEARERDE